MNAKIKQRIPDSWRQGTLLDVSVKLKTGGTPKSTNKSFYSGNIPFVKIDDMTSAGRYIFNTKNHINKNALENSSAWIVPADSILFSIYATVGEVAINKVDVATNQAIAGIVPDSNKVNGDFLYYSLVYLKPKLKKFFKETTQKNLTSEIVRNLEILLPPLTEQKKIAAILETLDGKIQKTDEIIQTSEKFKKGLMKKLFIHGIGHKKFKETELGKIPEGWKIKNFEEFAVLQRGFDLPVEQRTDGQYDLVTSNGVTDSHSQFKVKGPGVITGRSGTLGNVFYVKNNFWPLNTTLYIKNFKGNNEKFVYYKLLSFDISRFGTGTGVPTLNRNIVHKELVAVPEYAEQEKIVEILSAIDNKISINKKLKEEFIFLKKGLMSDLLTGKKRV